MPIEFKLPEVSEGVESVDIGAINVSEGDEIQEGQVVMELETEKAGVDLRAEHSGRVTKIHVQAGQTVKVGSTLMTIEEAGNGAGARPAEPPQADTRREPGPKSATSPAQEEAAPTEAPAKKPAPQPSAAAEHDDHRTPERTTPRAMGPEKAEASIEASEIAGRDGGHERPPAPAGPATRRLARQLGVDLYKVEGSGAGGRITEEDVQGYVRNLTTGLTRAAIHDVTEPMGAPQLPDFSKYGLVERQPMNKIARVSAVNLTQAWRTIPHVTQHDLADITDLEAARKQYMATLGKNGPKITMTAIVIKAVISALKAYPHFNASIDQGSNEIILKRYYHIGVAVDTENGLLVPVIRDCDKKSILEVAAALNDIAERARDKKLTMDEMQGATFTITNLGSIGGTSFTPIINPPEVAILGMSRAVKQLQLVDGVPSERLLLPLSLSYDHRVINGADAARFIVKLSGTLADFLQLLMQC